MASGADLGRKGSVCGISFNASLVNNRDIGDEDITLVDIPTVGPDEDALSSNDGATLEQCYGVDIFLFASERATRDRPVPLGMLHVLEGSPVHPQRSLADLYADNPNLRLSNIDKNTMALTGDTVKQIVLEATHGFLQESIPENKKQNVWSHIIGGHHVRGNKAEDARQAIISIAISCDKLRLHNSRPLSHLIDNCVSIITVDFSTSNPHSVKVVFDRGIALCDALGDNRRGKALIKAAHTLSWLMLGLDCRKMGVYQQLNQVLDKIDHSYPVRWIGDGDAKKMGVSVERRQAEYDMLEAFKRSFDASKEPFRVGFVQTLQKLLSLEE